MKPFCLLVPGLVLALILTGCAADAAMPAQPPEPSPPPPAAGAPPPPARPDPRPPHGMAQPPEQTGTDCAASPPVPATQLS